MSNAHVTVEIPPALLEDIKFAAHVEKVSPSALVTRILTAYLDAKDGGALREAILQEEAGELISHDHVERWLAEIADRTNKAA